VEFRRVEGRHVERPALDDVKRWREVIVRGARLRFRTDRPERRLAPVDPRMVSITEGNVLRSVSLRDPLRAQVAVWSGTNRVFTSHAPLLLAAIAEAMSDGLPARAAAQAHLGRKVDEQEAEMVECAAGQLRDLIRLETAACGPVTVSPDHGCARS
jgi:hypothetical protein